MAKIHFVAEAVSDQTGGFIYDTRLYRKLEERFGGDVKLFDYDYFGDEYAFLKRDFLQHGMCYRKHAEELLDCDYLFVNISMYQKFVFFPWRLKEKSRCRFIGIIHHLDYMSYEDITRGLREKLLLSLVGHCDAVITPNVYTRDCLKTLGFGDKTRVIEAYLDNTVHAGGGEKENLVCFTGTVEKRKGVDYAVRAFAEFSKTHPDYRFTAAGNFKTGYSKGPFCDDLLRLVSELGVEDKVSFPGRVTEEEKKDLFERSKIFLFPSLLEGYGWAMVEAMSYGLPVIAFDNSAMPYTVNETNGILVPDRDEAGLTEALCRLADDPELYDRLSRGAAEKVRSLPDAAAVDREYEEFLDDLGKLQV